MWRKLSALVLSFCLLSPCLSAQALSSDDKAIIEKQEQIISIAQSLIESDRISEQNLIARENFLNQKELVLRKKESDYATIDQDMATLKDSLEKQSKSLTHEQKRADAYANGCKVLVVVAAALGFYAVTK